MLFHFMSFHFISFHFISFHFISFHILCYNVQTCIAGSLGAGDSQILQEGMGGLLTGGPPPLLLLPDLLQLSPSGPAH